MTMEEAHTSSRQLEGTVHEVLTTNRDMSIRLRRLEMQLSTAAGSNSLGAGSFVGTLNDNMTTRSLIEDRARDQAITQTVTYGYTFDEDLQTSWVYARAANRQSNLSPPSETRSIGWSFFSGISLANISNISVVSLPIAVQEICNGHSYYSIHDRVENYGGPSDGQEFKIFLLGWRAEMKCLNLQ